MELDDGQRGATSHSAPSASAPNSGYASTYYPGTPSAAEAQKITFGRRTGSLRAPTFRWSPVRLARVTGLVVSSDGKPVEGAMISLAPPMSRELLRIDPPSSARSAKDGTFTLNSVAPGDYNLQSRSVQVITSDSGDDNMMVFRTAALDGGGEQEFGIDAAHRRGEDIDERPARRPARGEPRPATSPSTDRSRVDYRDSCHVDGGRLRRAAFGGGGSASLKEDGSFELKGVCRRRACSARRTHRPDGR